MELREVRYIYKSISKQHRDRGAVFLCSTRKQEVYLSPSFLNWWYIRRKFYDEELFHAPNYSCLFMCRILDQRLYTKPGSPRNANNDTHTLSKYIICRSKYFTWGDQPTCLRFKLRPMDRALSRR